MLPGLKNGWLRKLVKVVSLVQYMLPGYCKGNAGVLQRRRSTMDVGVTSLIF